MHYSRIYIFSAFIYIFFLCLFTYFICIYLRLPLCFITESKSRLMRLAAILTTSNDAWMLEQTGTGPDHLLPEDACNTIDRSVTWFSLPMLSNSSLFLLLLFLQNKEFSSLSCYPLLRSQHNHPKFPAAVSNCRFWCCNVAKIWDKVLFLCFYLAGCEIERRVKRFNINKAKMIFNWNCWTSNNAIIDGAYLSAPSAQAGVLWKYPGPS